MSGQRRSAQQRWRLGSRQPRRSLSLALIPSTANLSPFVCRQISLQSPCSPTPSFSSYQTPLSARESRTPCSSCPLFPCLPPCHSQRAWQSERPGWLAGSDRTYRTLLRWSGSQDAGDGRLRNCSGGLTASQDPDPSPSTAATPSPKLSFAHTPTSRTPQQDEDEKEGGGKEEEGGAVKEGEKEMGRGASLRVVRVPWENLGAVSTKLGVESEKTARVSRID